jgi:hypothetical protein
MLSGNALAYGRAAGCAFENAVAYTISHKNFFARIVLRSRTKSRQSPPASGKYLEGATPDTPYPLF